MSTWLSKWIFRGRTMYLALELLSMRSYGLEEAWLITRALKTFSDFLLKTAENSKDFANGVVRWFLRQSSQSLFRILYYLVEFVLDFRKPTYTYPSVNETIQ